MALMTIPPNSMARMQTIHGTQVYHGTVVENGWFNLFCPHLEILLIPATEIWNCCLLLHSYMFFVCPSLPPVTKLPQCLILLLICHSKFDLRSKMGTATEWHPLSVQHNPHLQLSYFGAQHKLICLIPMIFLLSFIWKHCRHLHHELGCFIYRCKWTLHHVLG